MEILKERVVSTGVTLVMVTHDLDLVPYADRVIHMVDGRITKIIRNEKGVLA